MEYRCISADSHLEILPDRYVHRVPAEYRDRAPRVITAQNGIRAVSVEGRPLDFQTSQMAGGKPFDERRPFDPLDGDDIDKAHGMGSPEQRLLEQDIDGVDAEILYPGATGPTYWRAIKSDDAYKAVLRAYNDWLAEEYCSVNPERLVGLGTIPVSSLEDAIAELRHCKELGLKAVVLTTFPSGNPYPVLEDDRFYEEALDLKMPLTIHVQFGFPLHGAPPPRPLFNFPKHAISNPEVQVPDVVERYNQYGIRGSLQAVQMISAGVFDRLPELQIYVAEVQIGWIPNWLEQLDFEWGREHFWVERVLGTPKLKLLPSEYVREHFWWGFNRNPVGVRIAKSKLGLDKVMWASDFPHLETDWPESQRVIDECCVGLSEEEKYRITVGNAVEYFLLNN